MTIKISNRGKSLPLKNENPQKKFSQAQAPRFSWPLKNIKKTKKDGRDGVKSIGILITGYSGADVLSSAKGKVKKIGQMRGYGKYIILEHENKYFTIYSKLKDITVKEGQFVEPGKYIGSIEGEQLHFQIDYFGKPIDPIRLLSNRG